MLGGHVLVLEPRHLVEGGHQDGAQLRTDRRVSTDLLGPRLQRRLQARGEGLRRNLETPQQGWHQPLGLLQEREQQVLGIDGGILECLRRLLSGLQGLLGTFGEAVEPHWSMGPPSQGFS